MTGCRRAPSCVHCSRGADLGLAEVSAALPGGSERPRAGTPSVRDGKRLRLLVEGAGDMLCVALDGTRGSGTRGRVAPARTGARLPDAAWTELTDVLHTLADETNAAGRRLAFHPHAGTYVETPARGRAASSTTTDPARVGICLDVGHYLVGGGDPVKALEWLGERVTHVHLKDVDPVVLARTVERARCPAFGEAVDQRIFTELGAGMLDLMGVLAGPGRARLCRLADGRAGQQLGDRHRRRRRSGVACWPMRWPRSGRRARTEARGQLDELLLDCDADCD